MAAGGESGAGWSEPDGATVATEPEHPFRTRAGRRYERVDVAGSGGMGTVFVARDRRLDREVALKQVAATVTDPTTARRLAHEARLTARLEHPFIVPVYDAGETHDGRRFYTMRLIRGRSLAVAIADADGPGERLALLRHFLDACHAIAYAHASGVVHRDLKPANIMVGRFGETQVVDWGLAAAIDAPPAGAGTPAYMSPEQAREGSVDPRTDVWSLGAVLFELVTGRRLIEGDRDDALDRLREQRVDLSPLEQVGAPADLCAIARKALATEPADRYPDAVELAAEVERFLDGRRVRAHDYTPGELLRRLVRAWRIPLAIAALGLVALAVTVALGWARVTSERTRAVEAEATSRGALRDARNTLGWALSRQAVSATRAGARAEAEIIAAHALAIEESPDARGVLASVYAGARPSGVRVSDPIPGCDRVVPAPPGRALCLGVDHLSLWQIDPRPRRTWSVELGALAAATTAEARVAALAPDGALVILDASDGSIRARVPGAGIRAGLQVSARANIALASDGRWVTAIDAATGERLWSARSCGKAPVEALAAGDALLAAVCGDGVLRIVALPDGEPREVIELPFGRRLAPAAAAAVSPDDREVSVAGLGGELVRIDVEAASADAPLVLAPGPAKQLAYTAGRLLVVPERGAAMLWDPRSPVELMRLPLAASQTFAVRDRELVTAGRAVWRWRLPDRAGGPWRLRAPAGLSSAAISPGGELVAAARGDGRTSVWRRRDGALLTELAGHTGVAKRVDFSAGGARLAVATADRFGSAVYYTRDFSRAPHEAAGRGIRRLGFLRDGTLVSVHYGEGLLLSSPGGETRPIDGPGFVDADVVPDRSSMLLLTPAGGIWRLRDGALEQVAVDPGAIAVTGDATRIAAAHATGVRIHPTDGAAEPRWLASRSGELLDVALSTDGRYATAGSRRGTTDVWDLATGELVAVLRGHTERVAYVGFGTGALLMTASWDGTVRLWDLSVLERSPGSLVESAESTWGADLEGALRSWGP